MLSKLIWRPQWSSRTMLIRIQNLTGVLEIEKEFDAVWRSAHSNRKTEDSTKKHTWDKKIYVVHWGYVHGRRG